MTKLSQLYINIEILLKKVRHRKCDPLFVEKISTKCKNLKFFEKLKNSKNFNNFKKFQKISKKFQKFQKNSKNPKKNQKIN